MVVEHVMTTRDGLYLRRGRGSIYKSSSSTVPIGPYITYGLSRGRILLKKKIIFQPIFNSYIGFGKGHERKGQKPIKFLPFRGEECTGAVQD